MFWHQAPEKKPWMAPDFSQSDGNGPEELRRYVEQRFEQEIDWYQRNIRSTRRFSRWLRIGTILFTSLGGLIPILESLGILTVVEKAYPSLTAADLELSRLGYLFLAIGGGFNLFDRFFGFSSAWMRSITTMLTLEKLREEFRMEWLSLTYRTQHAAKPDITPLLDLAKTTLLRAKDETEKETQAWVSEFKTNLSRFEKDLKTQLESTRPGALHLQVTDGAKAPDGFELHLDQMLVEKATGTTASAGPIAPGLHKVTVQATVDRKQYATSQMVTIPAGEVAELNVTLGIP